MNISNAQPETAKAKEPKAPSPTTALVPLAPTLPSFTPPPPPERKSSAGRRYDPLASLLRHKKLAFLIFLVVAMLGIPVAARFGKKVYYTEAVIYVSPRFMKNLQDDTEKELQSNSQYRDFVQQQMRTVGRYDIVHTALQRNPELMRGWRLPDESEQHAVERLQSSLLLHPVPETYQFTVGLEASKPDGLAELVNAVTDTFLEMDKRDEVYGKDRRVEDLHQEQTRLLGEVRQKMDERTKIAQALGVTTFTGDLINPYDHLIINRKNDLASTQRNRIEKEAELAAANADTPAAKAALFEQARELVGRDLGLNSLKDRLNERRRDLLARLSGLGPNHPGRKDAERELAEMDATIKASNDRLLDTYANMLLTQRQAQVKQTQRAEQEMASLLQEHTAQAREFSSQYQHALLLGVEITNINRRLGAVSDRINYLTLEAQAPGFMRLFSAARTPEFPFKGGRRKYLLIFLALGLVLGLVTPLVVDYLDPRLHTLSEAEALLGFAPLGGLLRYRNAREGHVAQDQLMRLACALERERRLNGSRIFLLTGTERSCGTTTLTLALAHTLQQLGIKAVGVEASMAYPDKRYLQTKEYGGLTARLYTNPTTHNSAPGSAARPHTPPVNAPSGTAASAQHWPGTNQRRARLQELARQYDVVLLDAPPVHLTADAEMLAAYADSTILLIKASETTRGKACRILQQMERWQLPAIGVALNRLDPQRDSELAALLPRPPLGLNRLSAKLWQHWL